MSLLNILLCYTFYWIIRLFSCVNNYKCIQQNHNEINTLYLYRVSVHERKDYPYLNKWPETFSSINNVINTITVIFAMDFIKKQKPLQCLLEFICKNPKLQYDLSSYIGRL